MLYKNKYEIQLDYRRSWKPSGDGKTQSKSGRLIWPVGGSTIHFTNKEDILDVINRLKELADNWDSI